MLHHQVSPRCVADASVRCVDEVPGEVHAIADVVRAAAPRPVLHPGDFVALPASALRTAALYHRPTAAGPGDVEGDAG